jgi:predicted transcriptional regulator
MAMTLRLTEDETAALRRRAEREGRSMQEVARTAVRHYIETRSRTELLDELFDRAVAQDAELLDRLAR